MSVLYLICDIFLIQIIIILNQQHVMWEKNEKKVG